MNNRQLPVASKDYIVNHAFKKQLSRGVMRTDNGYSLHNVNSMLLLSHFGGKKAETVSGAYGLVYVEAHGHAYIWSI
jgi:hypothetical protein